MGLAYVMHGGYCRPLAGDAKNTYYIRDYDGLQHSSDRHSLCDAANNIAV